jgi:hypothetical protein
VTLSARLQKVTQGLTPHQRAVLVLQALREGREPDPELRRIDDPVLSRAFNRYMALLWVINQHLGAVSRVTALRVELVENAIYYAELFSKAAAIAQEREGGANPKAHRDWRTRKETTLTDLLLSLAQEAKRDGIANLTHLWKEACALQAVREELAADFEGVDPLLPAQRDDAEEARCRLLAAADTLGVRRRLVDRDEEYVGVYQQEVNESFRHLGLAEPYK